MPSDYRPSLWDDTEPLYAPGRKKIRDTYYWVPPKKYKDAGYAVKSINIGKVHEADEADVARQCRILTREMVQWYDGEVESRVQEGSWGYLIQRYIHDAESAIHDVRPNTRAQYIKVLDRIGDAIGAVQVEETDYATLIGWRRAMEQNGRSTHYIKKWFTHFGLVLSHGVKIKMPGCRDVKEIRSEMRIKTPPRRNAYATRDQIEKIVAELDRRNLGYVSLAVLIRFEFMLRGVDVYGQWSPAEGRHGGIRHNGKLWEDGLTWEMIDSDVTSFTKVISKTRDSMTEPYTFDLTATHEIRRRLLAVPKEKRVGPVIVLKDGSVPKDTVLVNRFRRVVNDIEGIPNNLRISDARSGGITEAKQFVDPYLLRDAAQHTQVTTTDIYARGRSDGANKVVRLRAERTSGKPVTRAIK